MPGIDGVEAIAAIRAQWPDARIVMLTTYRGDAQALRALKAGASGYLLKTTIRTTLLDAIHSVMAGIASFPVRSPLSWLPTSLTTHCRLASWRSLGTSPPATPTGELPANWRFRRTPSKAHMKSIMSKLAANDRTHAVTIALKRGIIDV